MKIATVENVIERSDNYQDEQNFTIALTAKAIEVLSSQIYKDALLAIIRELGTNAADSHIEAGKRDLPFDVGLPNGMVPEFVIRDYGVGMSNDKVMTMYRTYFGSDKTNSNEVTGCLGLGSKSPLAYTDSFNVTSWYQGEKSVYTIYKNERGLPSINRMYNAPSDEPTGVEVRIAIEKNDFSEFHEKAIEVYQWFTPRPNVSAITDDEWPKDEYLLQSTDWSLRKQSYGYSVAKPMTVVMGNVGYPVDQKDLAPIIYKLGHAERILAQSGPVLRVKIGDVDIAASRETLKFDGNRTLPKIQELVKKMAAEIVEKFQAKLDECTTLWEARKYFRHCKQTPTLSSIIPSSVKWKDIDVRPSIPLVITNGKKKIEFAVARKYTYKTSRRSDKWHVSTAACSNIECEPRAEVFIVDSKNHVSRVSHYVRTNSKKNDEVVAYVLTKPEPKQIDDYEIGDMDLWFKEHQLDIILRKTSQLPDKPKRMVTSRSETYQTVEPDLNRYSNKDWQEKVIDFEKGGVYVEVYDNLWHAGPVGERKASTLDSLDAVMPSSEIVGVRKRSLKVFKAASQWQRLDEYLAQKYKNDKVARELAIKSEVCSSGYRLEKFGNIRSNTFSQTNGKFNELKTMIDDLQKASDSPIAQAYKVAAPFIGDTLDAQKEFSVLRKLYFECLKLYPMLDIVEFNDRNLKYINQYIEDMDNIEVLKKQADEVPTVLTVNESVVCES